MSLTAAASTIFLMTNFLMALSLGTQRAQFVQRMGWTCPRPFLARPLFLLFLVYDMEKYNEKWFTDDNLENMIMYYLSYF